MKVLIAGAGGYIGARLSSYLANEGFDVIAICNTNIPTDIKWVEKMYKIITVDVSSFDEIKSIKDHDIDVIINLVSLDHHQSNKDPDFVNNINTTPTWNFLNEFSKRNLSKFIYLSTIQVYGNNLTGDINEQAIAIPINAYGLTHLISEQINQYYSNITDIDCFNIRLANGYGPPQFITNNCWELVINNICLNALKERKIIIKSDGSPVRDFIYLPDVLLGIKKLLLQPKVSNKTCLETINFSSGATISIYNTAVLVSEVFQARYGQPIDIFINETQKVNKELKTDPILYTINNSKFIDLLKGLSLTTLKQGIHDVFHYLDHNLPIA